jgi:hypothetical protein
LWTHTTTHYSATGLPPPPPPNGHSLPILLYTVITKRDFYRDSWRGTRFDTNLATACWIRRPHLPSFSVLIQWGIKCLHYQSYLPIHIKVGVSDLDCDVVLPPAICVRHALRISREVPIYVWRGNIEEQVLQWEFDWDIGTKLGSC